MASRLWSCWVSVSIIAMLMSLLLPSLRAAREQAKKVACQSNMHQINTALITYLTDYDELPVYYRLDEDGCINGWCTWSYGGWLGRNPYWVTRSNGAFWIPACQRPLTVYMNKGEVTPPISRAGDEYEACGQPVFKCPSDKTSAQWQWADASDGGARDTYSSYDDVGTSYHLNYYWWNQTDKGFGADWDDDGMVELTPGWCQKEPIVTCTTGQELDWPCRFRQGRDIWRKYQAHNSSRFVTLGEERFDFAIVEGIQLMGAHGRFSRHNLAFLDGHVSEVPADTRWLSGTQWTVLDEELEQVGF